MNSNFEYISNNLFSNELENSPLKVLNTYFKEKLNNENFGQKTPRTLRKLKKTRVVENEIFKNREPSGKSLKEIIGGMRYFKDSSSLNEKREEKKKNQFSDLSRDNLKSSISLRTNTFINSKRADSTKRDTSYNENSKILSNREKNTKFLFNRLSKIRTKYQEDHIQQCRKMIKLNKWF